MQRRRVISSRVPIALMLKRFISVSVLLLVVAVQALAADCELRCATMVAAPGHNECGNVKHARASSTQAVHCHGRSMESSEGNQSVSAIGHCRASLCKLQSEAIAKQSGVKDLKSQASAILFPVQAILDLTARGSAQSTIGRSVSRPETRAPLDLRPGSSLRI